MNFKKVGSHQYEIYLPSKREWSPLEKIEKFIQKIAKEYFILEAGYYYVLVTINEIGTLFQITQLEKYLYKKKIDLQIITCKEPFYIKSKSAFIYQKSCYYYQNFFYGTTKQLNKKLLSYEFIEFISLKEYQEAKKRGIYLSQRKDFSSL